MNSDFVNPLRDEVIFDLGEQSFTIDGFCETYAEKLQQTHFQYFEERQVFV